MEAKRYFTFHIQSILDAMHACNWQSKAGTLVVVGLSSSQTKNANTFLIRCRIRKRDIRNSLQKSRLSANKQPQKFVRNASSLWLCFPHFFLFDEPNADSPCAFSPRAYSPRCPCKIFTKATNSGWQMCNHQKYKFLFDLNIWWRKWRHACRRPSSRCCR